MLRRTFFLVVTLMFVAACGQECPPYGSNYYVAGCPVYPQQQYPQYPQYPQQQYPQYPQYPQQPYPGYYPTGQYPQYPPTPYCAPNNPWCYHETN